LKFLFRKVLFLLNNTATGNRLLSSLVRNFEGSLSINDNFWLCSIQWYSNGSSLRPVFSYRR